MKTEEFKTFLMASDEKEKVDILITAAERLEAYYEKSLEEITLTEDESQNLRMSIYLDEEVTPLNKKVFPDVIKLYYQFVHNKSLPAINYRIKGNRR